MVNGMLPFHKFGRRKIFSRFSRLRRALRPCQDLELLNPTSSPGGYAWIHCSGRELCAEYFSKVKLAGDSGTYYGGTDRGTWVSVLWHMYYSGVPHKGRP